MAWSASDGVSSSLGFKTAGPFCGRHVVRIEPFDELDALNHNWLLASLQRRLLVPTARARYESH